MWHWKNNGPRPPIDPHDCLMCMLAGFMIYFASIYVRDALEFFILAIWEWVHPTGRFGRLSF